MTRPRKLPTRLFVDAPLNTKSLVLDAERGHYLGRVLRCREGDEIVVFNTRGTERFATVESLSRRRPVVKLGRSLDPLPEPEVPILLLQALVKSDAMDLIVQKATELGVASIHAMRTEFSVVRLNDERKQRKLGHWQRIATSACEQSGRHCPPTINLYDTLSDAIAALPKDIKRIAFDIGANEPLDRDSATTAGTAIAIGPEGGFSPEEIRVLEAEGFDLRSFGPRTLRAETAAIAALATAQNLIGDLG